MYFEWKKKPFIAPSDLSGTPSTPDVTVVGGGPSGLAMAITLAMRGMNVIVLEQRDTVSDGSRAIGFHRGTSQFFEHIGIGERFQQMCHVRPVNRLFISGEVFAETRYSLPEHERHPEQAILQQCWVEEMLVDRAADFPSIDIRWQSTVEKVVPDDDGVTISVRTPEGSYDLRTPYVVAADGARGTVRRELGLKFETPVNPLISDRHFVICDFELETDLEPGRRLYLDLPYDPGASALFHYQPFGVWRLDYPLSDEQDPEAETTPERAHARVRQHLDMMGETQDFNIIWTTSYRARARTLPRYAYGRVLFVGDAAHQTPIFGGRGLNSGFADVWNLGWRLPRVVKGIDTPDSLERYSDERVHVMLGNLEALTQVATFMTQPTPGTRLIRQAALQLARTEPFVRELVDGHSARKVDAYPREEGEPTLVGTPLGEVDLTDTAGGVTLGTFLRDQLGDGYTLFRYDPADDADAHIADVDDLLPFTVVTVRSAAEQGLVDASGNLRAKLGLVAGDRVLVRPDGYVAALWNGAVTAATIADAIRGESGQSPAGAPTAPEASPRTVTQRMFLALSQLADTHDREALAVELSKALLVLAAHADDTTIVDHIEALAAVPAPERELVGASA